MTSHAIHDSAYSWARLALSVLIASIGTVGIWAIVMVMPAMQAEYAVGRGDVSLPFTVTMIGFAFGASSPRNASYHRISLDMTTPAP